ncbi:MAG: NAD(P)H-dependent oxidoreductase, partial [Planctomycetes bacterium]|nr:NAD(P)H-dependent oxidoreductase [Planctomycetota bacterium]
GMVPAALKNFFLLCDAKVLAHKPALIVAVSAGLGGSYPVAELRTSSYKNTRICYIPEHVIVRNVARMLKNDVPADDEDQALRDRITYACRLLIEYARGMQAIRDSGVIDHKKHPYGM